jgi:uncharacterized protein (DUF983 family)
MFRGPFAMYERCRACGLVFEREQGYFVGAIYVNYAATVAITIAGFLVLERYTTLGLTTQIALWSGFSIVFPLVFFRHSRSLWFSLDYLFNPEPSESRGLR